MHEQRVARTGGELEECFASLSPQLLMQRQAKEDREGALA